MAKVLAKKLSKEERALREFMYEYAIYSDGLYMCLFKDILFKDKGTEGLFEKIRAHFNKTKGEK